MDEIKTIKSLDELFFYAQEAATKDNLPTIKLEGKFTIELHIEGATWDRRIDSRSAQYIISLQNTLDDLLDEFAPEANKKELLVKMENRDGSFLSSVDITRVLESMVSKLNSGDIFILAMTAIAAIGGYFMWSRYLERKSKIELEQERTKQITVQEETRRKEAEEATRQEEIRQEYLQKTISLFQSHADANPERFASYERPIRTITKALDAKDTIQVNTMKDIIPAETAKKCGPRRAPRSEETITYADGSYIVNSRRYDEGEVVLELEQNDITIKGYLWQLDDDDRTDFISLLDEYEKNAALPFSMDLQLNVAHTRRKLKHAVIIGQGAPRAGKVCKPLNQILNN